MATGVPDAGAADGGVVAEAAVFSDFAAVFLPTVFSGDLPVFFAIFTAMGLFVPPCYGAADLASRQNLYR